VLSLAWRNSGAAACLAVAGDTHGVSEPASYAVVVLAGGTARRMGGGDKTALDLGAGRTVLDHLVSSLDTSVPVVVVGPSRPLERPVRWVRESPVGGGPVAGLAAGLDLLRSDGAEWVAVVAGDQPFAGPGIAALVAALPPVDAEGAVDAVLAVDSAGRDQPLLAVYRRRSLAAVLAASEQPAAGRSMRSVVGQLAVARLPLPPEVLLDIDDEPSLSAARAMLAPPRAGNRPER
jgi:molybdopterin-guanine dinucleotide biosynthesis protein A